MLYWYREGDKVRQGLNIYRPSNTHSAGGVLRLGSWVWRIRYSKFSGMWFSQFTKLDTRALANKT